MEAANDLEGQFCRLPDGQVVEIESCEGNKAVVRRIDGPRRGTLAVCPIDKLRFPQNC